MADIIPPSFEEARRSVELLTGRAAVLAGGAVRDTLAGKPVKDLDIFVSLRPGEHSASHALYEIFQALPGSDKSSKRFSADYVDEEFQGVVDYRPDDGSRPWRIVLTMPLDGPRTLAAFGDGLSQVGWDGSSIFATEAYYADVAGRRVTILRDTPTHRQHAERVATKYGYPLRRPRCGGLDIL